MGKSLARLIGGIYIKFAKDLEADPPGARSPEMFKPFQCLGPLLRIGGILRINQDVAIHEDGLDPDRSRSVTEVYRSSNGATFVERVSGIDASLRRRSPLAASFRRAFRRPSERHLSDVSLPRPWPSRLPFPPAQSSRFSQHHEISGAQSSCQDSGFGFQRTKTSGYLPNISFNPSINCSTSSGEARPSFFPSRFTESVLI